MDTDDNEQDRLAALRESLILDTPTEEILDSITQLAAYICDVPICLISLVNGDRQWFKAAQSLPGIKEMPRESAFCNHAILGAEPLEVQDARLDKRFQDNPLVTGEPYIRFYAAMPLIDPGGHRLGALCVIDRRARALSQSQRAGLQELARMVVSLLEAQKATSLATRLGEALEKSFNEIYFIDTGTQRFVHANESARRNLQYSLEELKQLSLLETKIESERSVFAAQLALLQLGRQDHFVLESRHRRKDGSSYPVEVRVQLSSTDPADPTALVIANDISERKRLQNDLWQAHERLWTAIQASPLATLALDVNGAVQSWSPAAERLFGWREQEVIGRPPPFVPRDRYYEFHILLKRVADGEVLANVEMRRQRRDGTPLDLSLSAAPLCDAAGRVTGVMAVLADLTETKQVQKALQSAQDFSRTLLENLSEGVIICDSGGKMTLFNRVAREWFGADASEIPPEQWAERYNLYYPDAVTPLRYEDIPLARALEGETVRGAEIVIVRQGQPTRHLLVNGDPLLDSAGKLGAVIVMRDITERKRGQQALIDKERRYRLTLDNSLDAFIAMDADGSIIEWNRQAATMFGWSRSELMGKPLHSIIIPERFREKHIQGMARFLTTGEQRVLNRRVEVTGRHRDGHEFPVELSVVPIKHADGYTFSASLRDITESKDYQQQLEHQANHDILTGLPNRNLLKDRLAQAMLRAQRYERQMAVAFIDLDGFKLVNDSLGHDAGDQLLKTVAERLKSCLRDIDTVSRLSGDEFVLVLNDQDSEETVHYMLERVLAAVSKPLIIKNGATDTREIQITCSIGYSVYPRDGEDGGDLARKADTAMYRAKEQGRNNYQAFSISMNEDADRRLSMESGLRRALERDELFLEYQPQVDLTSGRVIAAEALLRWRHPQAGRMAPAGFIRLAESSGLIVPIGEWVLSEACAQNKAWLDAGLPAIKVSVNLSTHQFRQKDLIESVLSALDRTELDPELLDLELTEGLFMQEAGQVIDTLVALKALGVQLSIDDFGTGFSNLNRLKRFPIDRLMIDQSFIKDLVTGPKDTAIVQSMISLAHGLGLKVIAEAVETEKQLAFLRAHGCDEIQGFYFSKPVTAEEFTALLKQDRRLPPFAGR